MEDAYSFIVDFAGVRGQGYFAVFDGHAGKYAAEWCGGHFHEVCKRLSFCILPFGVSNFCNLSFSEPGREVAAYRSRASCVPIG